jgi:hypothetical protein
VRHPGLVAHHEVLREVLGALPPSGPAPDGDEGEEVTVYYKATRPDGRDFYTGTIDYADALASGEVIRHPSSKKVAGDAGTYLSVSTEPADCTGFSWPCRLFRVEPVGRVGKADASLRHKRTTRALRVVEELPAWMALGPNGEEVARFIASCSTLTSETARKLDAAWDAARDAAWDAARAAARDAARAAARDVARDAARDAAWDAARDAAWDAARAAARDAARAAARALVGRDLLTPEQFALLTGPWVSVMGKTWEAAQ